MYSSADVGNADSGRAGMDIRGRDSRGMDMGSSNGAKFNLTAAKESRKRAEQDAQLLANRIALLKQEEDKAWKKIEETRKRAEAVQKDKTRREELRANKEKFYRNKWESNFNQAQQNKFNAQRGRAAREDTRRQNMETKRQTAGAMKERARDMEHEKAIAQKTDVEQARLRAQMIKDSKNQSRARLEQERKARADKFQSDYDARITQEQMMQSKTESIVAQMEKEEMDLISRLQNTQMMQREAYKELEEAIGDSRDALPMASLRKKTGSRVLGIEPAVEADIAA